MEKKQEVTPIFMTPKEYKDLGQQKIRERDEKLKQESLAKFTTRLNEYVKRFLTPNSGKLPFLVYSDTPVYIDFFQDYIKVCNENTLIKELEKSGWFVEIKGDYDDIDYHFGKPSRLYDRISIRIHDTPRKLLKWPWQKTAKNAPSEKNILYQSW